MAAGGPDQDPDPDPEVELTESAGPEEDEEERAESVPVLVEEVDMVAEDGEDDEGAHSNLSVTKTSSSIISSSLFFIFFSSFFKWRKMDTASRFKQLNLSSLMN